MKFFKLFGCGLFFLSLCFAMDVKTDFFDEWRVLTSHEK